MLFFYWGEVPEWVKNNGNKTGKQSELLECRVGMTTKFSFCLAGASNHVEQRNLKHHMYN